ncbi:MAG: Crp/Fnr family transcriptional regulator [Pyrinomonadaceae bacterium]
MERIEIFKQAELFRSLDDETLRLLSERAIEKRLERNEILFLADDEAKGLYLIAEGAVRAFRTGHDGREQIIHIERAVATIAELPVFDDGKYPSTVAAEEPTLLYFLDKNEMRRRCFEHPQIALSAAALFARRLRGCAELVEMLTLREVSQRLARYLFEQAQETGEPDGNGAIRFKQNLTHNQLAARIGTVREVVTRSFYRLQNQRLIETRNKDVLIYDLQALAAYFD